MKKALGHETFKAHYSTNHEINSVPIILIQTSMQIKRSLRTNSVVYSKLFNWTKYFMEKKLIIFPTLALWAQGT